MEHIFQGNSYKTKSKAKITVSKLLSAITQVIIIKEKQ